MVIVAIGSPHHDNNKGHVRVYEFSSNSWTQLGSDIDGEATGDMSGFSVSLSSNGYTVAIGAEITMVMEVPTTFVVMQVYTYDGSS